MFNSPISFSFSLFCVVFELHVKVGLVFVLDFIFVLLVRFTISVTSSDVVLS